MATRKVNLSFEGFFAILNIINLIIVLSYGAQLRLAGHVAQGDGDSFQLPSKLPMMAMYGVPTVVTLLLSINNIVFYLLDLLGPLYALLSVGVSCAGWFVTLIFWGHCHEEGLGGDVWNGSKSAFDYR